ncbi:MAG: hypothetical protein AAB281_04675, partial [Actinomycetota bacterium]
SKSTARCAPPMGTQKKAGRTKERLSENKSGGIPIGRIVLTFSFSICLELGFCQRRPEKRANLAV